MSHFEMIFQPPRWHKGWRLLQAVDFGPACPQPIIYTGATKGVRDMDEDCLYLNIYAPTVSLIALSYRDQSPPENIDFHIIIPFIDRGCPRKIPRHGIYSWR